MLTLKGLRGPCSGILKPQTLSPRVISSHAGLTRRRIPLPRFVVRAGGSEGDGNNQPKKKSVKSALDEALEELQKKGMTPAKAREILKVWADLGAKDPAQLKELLVKRSMKPVTGLAFQTFLDSAAAIGGFYTGNLVGQADFTGSIFVSLAIYFFAFYYFIQAGAELTALVSLIAAARRYSTNTEALLAAVQQLAGPASGLGVLNSVQLAVNTYKIIQTLDSISESLKAMSDSADATDTFKSLSAYLALQRAQERYGFEPSRYGLSEKGAVRIAAVFAEFDVNDDGRLELGELRTLCNRLDKQLNDDELKKALALLDVGNTGFVQFADFVEWFQGLRPDQATREKAASESTSTQE